MSSRRRRSRASRAGGVRTAGFFRGRARFRAAARGVLAFRRVERLTARLRRTGFCARLVDFLARVVFRRAMGMSFYNLDSFAISGVSSDAYRNSGDAVRAKSDSRALTEPFAGSRLPPKNAGKLDRPVETHGVVE